MASSAGTYVFVRGSNNMSANLDLERSLQIRRQYGSNFLWMRHGGHTYLIRDVDTLDAIDALFRPMNALDPEYERLHAKMKPLEKRENQLDDEADAISDDDDRSERDEARLRDLHRELRDVERDLRVLEREEEELDRKQEQLEAEAEKAMVPILRDAIRKGIAKEQ